MKREKTKDGEKRRLVWVDWVLLFLLTGAILLGGFFVYGRRRAVAPTATVLYILRVSDLPVEAAADAGGFSELIPIGSSVQNSAATATLGRVASLSVRPHVQFTEKDGESLFFQSPDRVDLYVTVRAQALEKAGDGYRVSDIRIAAGDSGDYHIGGFFSSAQTVFVKKEQEE